MVQMTLFTKQKYSGICSKQTYGDWGERGAGERELGHWECHADTTIFKTDN